MAAKTIEKQKRVKRNYLAHKEIPERGYDKKLLWRANLYIDEGAEDWNDLHPWNAPPDAAAYTAMSQADKGKIKWWSESWGYNEWNRKYASNADFENNKTVGLSNLPAGNGKQVVALLETSPLRTLGGEVGSPNAENYLPRSVAYSYPYHRYQPEGGWASPVIASAGDGLNNEPSGWDADSFGNPGSMDSPFDFVWKMRQQNIDSGFSANKVDAKASNNRWFDYAVTAPSGGTGANLQANDRYKDIKYIPGLGLYYWKPRIAEVESYKYNGAADEDELDGDASPSASEGSDSGRGLIEGAHKKRNASWLIEAGTDRIGFAQRAASYDKTGGYEWLKLPPGMMEYNGGAGTEDPYEAMKVASNRRYPVPGSQVAAAVTVVQTLNPNETDGIKSKDWGIDESIRAIDLLRKVVPGDIWVKDSINPTSGGDQNDYWNNHIAIVASVPDNPEAITDPQEYMNQMILIEGEFTNKIQSVIKKLNVGDYNRNNVISDTIIYPSFALSSTTLLPDGLRCQSWAIRRLK